MSYYDEDFYMELSEFEEQIEEMKASLASSVQKKFLDEMDALRKENELLREFRDHKEAYERELRQVKAEYNVKMRDAQREADRKRLKDLLSLFSVIGYRPKPEYKQGPKCDKCDDNRKIHFISPSGREMTESCPCAVTTPVYSPKKVPLVSFYAGKELNDVYFERVDENIDYDRYDYIAYLYDKGQRPFEKINQYRVVFLDVEECQKYCDWLNEQEEKP